ncbi:LOW QUALITY PROTEIN: lysozyme g-like protein 2 [Acridotheres tristis]
MDTNIEWIIVAFAICAIAMEKQAGAKRCGNTLNVDTTGALEATVKPDGLSCGENCPLNLKKKVIYIICEFLSQRRQQKKMEKYHAKTAKAGNNKGVAPAVTIAGITFQESNAGIVLKDGLGDHGNPFGLMQICRVRRVAEALLKGNPLTIFCQHFGQVKANANQTKANADQAVSSQNQGRTPASKEYHQFGKPWDTEDHLAQNTEILYRMINTENIPIWDKGVAPQRLSFVSFEIKSSGISAYNAGVNTVQTYNKMVVGKTHNYANDVDARTRFYKRNGY